MQVGHRHFGRRDEIQVVRALASRGDLEQLVFELGQIAGAEERRVLDHERRVDLFVSVLPRVQFDHETHERALELRAGSPQDAEPWT